MSSNLTSLTAGTVPLAGADLIYGVQGSNSRRFPASAFGVTFGPRQGMINGEIVHSRTGNAETIAVKTMAGADPSASDPVLFIFQDGTGGYALRSHTTTLSVTISSGSTMGFTSSQASRLWVGALDNSGTVELFAVNARSSTNIMALNEWSAYSTTAEGGAGAADSAQVLYSTTSRISKYICLLSLATWEAGLTAGTWNTAPSSVILFGPGVPRPGDPVQSLRSASGTSATGTTILPSDNSVPQNTEGVQFMSQAITPVSAANILTIMHQGTYAISIGDNGIVVALFSSIIGAAGLAAVTRYSGAGADVGALSTINHKMLAATTSATTFTIRAGPGAAATITFNGTGGAQLLGGVSNSILDVMELQG